MVCSEKEGAFGKLEHLLVCPRPSREKNSKELTQKCIRASNERPNPRVFILPTARLQFTLPFQCLAGSRPTGVGGKIGTEKKEMRLSNTIWRKTEVLPVQLQIFLNGSWRFLTGVGDMALKPLQRSAPETEDVCQLFKLLGPSRDIF